MKTTEIYWKIHDGVESLLTERKTFAGKVLASLVGAIFVLAFIVIASIAVTAIFIAIVHVLFWLFSYLWYIVVPATFLIFFTVLVYNELYG